jgi:hypothetical protein
MSINFFNVSKIKKRNKQSLGEIACQVIGVKNKNWKLGGKLT